MHLCCRLLVVAAVFAISLRGAGAEDLPEVFRKAQDLVRREQFAAALPLLEKCVAAEPGN